MRLKTMDDMSNLNELLLWKANRNIKIDTSTIKLLNSIDIQNTEMDKEKTTKILEELLNTKGVRLVLASTILEYYNPDIYQIIDKRIYRLLYEKKIDLKYNKKYPQSDWSDHIILYFKYLKDLREACVKHSVSFTNSDQVLPYIEKKKQRLKNKKA